MKASRLAHRFVGCVPEDLAPGTIYVSTAFSTAVHLCACGCDVEVVTPIGPRGWRMGWNGRSITLEPSVGNYCLPCHSHYIIRDGMVEWLPDGTLDPSDGPPWRRLVRSVFRAIASSYQDLFRRMAIRAGTARRMQQPPRRGLDALRVTQHDAGGWLEDDGHCLPASQASVRDRLAFIVPGLRRSIRSKREDNQPGVDAQEIDGTAAEPLGKDVI